MISTFEKLPTLEELNEIILSVNQQIQRRGNEHENEIKLLKMQIELLNFKLYGRRSEKLSAEEVMQGRLFDEIEAHNEEENGKEKKVEVKGHARRKNGRRPIPEHFPRVEIVIDLPEEEKFDKSGRPLKHIGDVISEKLDIIPAAIKVKRYIRRKYAVVDSPNASEEEPGVKTAPMPPQIIPQGIATPGLLAFIGISKFCDAVPLYRQEKVFDRYDIDMPRSTMCSWFIYLLTHYNPSELMMLDVACYPILGVDETRVQVHNEPGRADTTISWMWVFRGGGTGRPLIYYEYVPSRSRDVIRKLLTGYQGVIQTDGLKVYEYFDKSPGITHAGCWAHARRNFFDATKSCVNAEFSRAVVDIIRKLYVVEDEARDRKLSYDEIAALRQEKSKPVLDKLKDLLEKRRPGIAPQSNTGKAITYVLNRWDSLCVYLYDGRIFIDNNLTENAIRPFTLGRKNWMFSGSPRGAAASAMMYSLVETAKANGMEPYWYLRYLFEMLPTTTTDDERRGLLPHVVDPAVVEKFRRDGVN
jgi:transposase